MTSLSRHTPQLIRSASYFNLDSALQEVAALQQAQHTAEQDHVANVGDMLADVEALRRALGEQRAEADAAAQRAAQGHEGEVSALRARLAAVSGESSGRGAEGCGVLLLCEAVQQQLVSLSQRYVLPPAQLAKAQSSYPCCLLQSSTPSRRQGTPVATHNFVSLCISVGQMAAHIDIIAAGRRGGVRRACCSLMQSDLQLVTWGQLPGLQRPGMQRTGMQAQRCVCSPGSMQAKLGDVYLLLWAATWGSLILLHVTQIGLLLHGSPAELR